MPDSPNGWQDGMMIHTPLDACDFIRIGIVEIP
jgi:hypothetical protein